VLDAVSARVEGRWVVDRESALPPDDDVVGVLEWIHDRAYIDRVREASASGERWIDSEDCGVSVGTFDAAVASAGLAMQAALDLVNGRVRRAFVVSRPPAHHAHFEKAAGYCFFNAIALAAEVITRSGNPPVVVADFGALHGDGIQEHFFEREDLGFVSVHRYPAFPGSGGADEVGEGAGTGTIRNVPLAGGAGDEIFCDAFENALDGICGQLHPTAILLAAGFDAYSKDPLGGMQVTEEGFRRLTATAVAAAERWCGGRLLSFLEGGFDLQGLAKSARIHVEELAKTSSDKPPRE
jgi:acetoin utilization deacetylase AcuC-like enzyme